jgi:holo-[acyl-carrier protein] synthase
MELNIGHFLIGEAISSALAPHPAHARAMDEAARRRGSMISASGSDLSDIRVSRRASIASATASNSASSPSSSARAPTARHDAAASYAKRFAAKEACAKALGTGMRRGVFWRDMGVVNMRSGQPTMQLTGGALARLHEMTPPGMKAVIHLSLTDDHPYAQAFVIIEALPYLPSEAGEGDRSPRPASRP